MYTIGVLECSNDIVFILGGRTSQGIEIEKEGIGWPYSQILPDRSSMCAENLELETVWRPEYDSPPSLTYTHQYVPIPYRPRGVVIVSIEIKYVEKDIIWEYVDSCCASVALVCNINIKSVFAIVPRDAERHTLSV